MRVGLFPPRTRAHYLLDVMGPSDTTQAIRGH
nr:MAG TPA: hypothetical protein [Microviridae sp.]